jgi:hypothetical protein
MSTADRLSRIADAHTRGILAGGLFDDVCFECDHTWPCPTYVWATTERNVCAPWNPLDDDGEDA